jgi:UDP-2,4-diacetamido-2,4,6-trideoxy-beta-L-altropyranose hydrolase
MKILFRCDSSFSTGSGHLIRCLNLAELISQDTIFLCRKLHGNINLRVQQNQFKLIEFPDIQDYKIGSPINEIEEIEAVLQNEAPDVIVVDHYGLDKSWEKAAKKYCKLLVVIDDLGREHNASAIIDQNYRVQHPANYLESGAQLFLGPHYAVLNKNFLESTSVKRSFKNVKQVLVFFGGSDPKSMTLRSLKLPQHFDHSIKWKFVVGSQNQDAKKIQSEANQLPNIEVLVDVNNMHELMLQSDIFIGAGGSTSWERAKLGLPSVVVSIAENQEELSKELAAQGIIHYLGRSQDLDMEEFVKNLQEIFHNNSKRELMSQKALSLKVSSKLNDFVQFIKSS